jgi:hypothetical protein
MFFFINKIKRLENVTLKEALVNKLKTRNYEIDKCCVYNKDTL